MNTDLADEHGSIRFDPLNRRSSASHSFSAFHLIRNVSRAIDFIRRTQTADGAWPGRWGVNYIYGTWQVLQGLQAIGFSMRDPMVRQAVGWVLSVQQPAGSWGESCASYDDPRRAGIGAATASQTAWALLALIAAGEAMNPGVRAGVKWLLDTQRPDGSWHEEPFTGTGFPKVFYLKYHMYSLYFPLMALARYERSARKARMKDEG
jgi:squalene-hopene/tetraprenyl-beta-curcumene cyclase